MFLYGMQVMGDGLAKVSGGKLEQILENLTSSKWKAVLLGMCVTAVIQSSSATTVMVVGFVNSGIMKLTQAVGIIMGANIGTTITSWILSLTGIESSNFFISLLKPSSFSPILALIGIVLLTFTKSSRKKDVGTILLGFAVLMFGMESMSGAVKPLADVPEFTGLLLKFSNPVAGILAGTILTAIIQSSSASVGILQALCMTGAVPYSLCIPDHHGTEYRYLCDSTSFCNRCKQKCKACGNDPSVFQPDRNRCVYGTFLYDQCSCAFSVYGTDGNTGNDRNHTQCIQYHGNTCMASVL